MRRINSLLLLFVTAGCLFGAATRRDVTARSSQPPANQNRALLVGVSQYERGYVFRIEPPYGQETFKLIATGEPADFSPLLDRDLIARGAIRDRESNSPLGQLLMAVTMGRRASRAGVNPTEWATTSITFEVTPRQAVTVQRAPPDLVFDIMRRSVLSLDSNSIAKGDEGAKLLGELRTNIAILEDVLTEGNRPAIQDDYLSSLILDAVVLGRLAERGGASVNGLEMAFSSKLRIDSEAAAIAALRDVASDLAIKTAQLKGSRGGAAQLIKVTVRAKRAGLEVNDYEVWYVPKGWADVTEAFTPFDKVGSPSTKYLAPGNYFLWMRRGKEETERRPFDIGGDRQQSREIDLVVP